MVKSVPEIISPRIDTKGVSANTSLNFISESPPVLSRLPIRPKEKEVLHFNELIYEIATKGSKTVKIDTTTLEPKTKYLLEVNETDSSVGKVSIPAISFTTEQVFLILRIKVANCSTDISFNNKNSSPTFKKINLTSILYPTVIFLY